MGEPQPVFAALLAGAPDPDTTPDAVSERILDAALALFGTVGIRRSSMGDVAKRAGIGRGTVYNRYANKDELVQAVGMREISRVSERIITATRAHDRPEERVAAGFVTLVRSIREHPLMNALLALEPEQMLPYLTVEGAPVIALARAFITVELDLARSEGMAVEGDVELIAEILARLAHSLLLTPAGAIPIDDDTDAHRFARTYLAPIITGEPRE